MNEKVPEQEVELLTEEKKKAVKEARMEISMLRQERHAMGNMDREEGDFQIIFSQLEKGILSPEEAVKQALKIRHGAQRE